MKVFLTGATGYLGHAIGQQLLAQGDHLRVLVRDESRLRLPASQALEVVRGDLNELAELYPLLDGVDAICHAAGVAHTYGGVDRFIAGNAHATLRLCQAARYQAIHRMVYISSLSVYTVPELRRQAAFYPPTPYARSKYLAEEHARAVFADQPEKLVILRLAAIYGPAAPGNMSRLIQLIATRRFRWLGDGSNRKCLVNRDDAAAAVAMALRAPMLTGAAIFDVTEAPRSMAEIVGAIGNLFGYRPRRLPISPGVAVVCIRLLAKLPEPGLRLAYILERWMAEEKFSADEFSSWTGWTPQVKFETALRAQIEAQGWAAAVRA